MAEDLGKLITDVNAATSVGLYFVKAVEGKVGESGAPIVHYALTVQAASGHVSGIAELTQAVAPPNSLHRFPVTGQIYHTGLGHDTLLVTLHGEYTQSLPPSEVLIPVRFTATLSVNKDWNGHGGFTYGKHHVENVPVKVIK